MKRVLIEVRTQCFGSIKKEVTNYLMLNHQWPHLDNNIKVGLVNEQRLSSHRLDRQGKHHKDI